MPEDVVVFHNGSNYDYRFFIKAVARNVKDNLSV